MATTNLWMCPRVSEVWHKLFYAVGYHRFEKKCIQTAGREAVDTIIDPLVTSLKSVLQN